MWLDCAAVVAETMKTLQKLLIIRYLIERIQLLVHVNIDPRSVKSCVFGSTFIGRRLSMVLLNDRTLELAVSSSS